MKNKIKIGIVCYPTYGGSGVVATELGVALSKKKYEVHFISYDQPFRLDLFSEKIYYHEVSVPQYPLFEYAPYELNLTSKLVDVALKVNREVTKFVIKKTLERLEENGKSISSSKILILGISYKSNIDDIRESPSLDIVRHLLKLNAEIFYDDKYVTPNSLGDITNNVKRVSDSTLTEENISMYDAILILTNHDYYNNENILMHGEIVVDTRGIFSSNEKNVVRG